MNGQPDIDNEVKKWINRAEHDLLAAQYMMTSPEADLTAIICYHCQQCAEKYLKAYLIFCKEDFPRTHDLRILLQMAQKYSQIKINWPQIAPLNRYVIEGRYPGDWEPINKDDAVNAIETASQVKNEIRSLLPENLKT